jgi:HEAT repeat protein
MGFKVETSFLRFLTMGALAAQRVMQAMTAEGLRPIELERYSSSNKIWMTKVKRLRLPDLLCVRTGLRVEVRAKSKLAIQMSDAPNNEQRRWYSGLHEDDLIAFVHCREVDDGFVLAPQPELFRVRELRACPEDETRLGPAKSASEGSERSREWPTIVPAQNGQIVGITDTQIRTRLESGRAQTYQRRNLNPYVAVGDRFIGEAHFVAGLPARKASFSEFIGRPWNPRPLLGGNALDRFVASKALGVVGVVDDLPSLRNLLRDQDARVALEAAGSLAKLGDAGGLAELVATFREPREEYLPMESVFLLSEQSASPLISDAADALCTVASNNALENGELRQAAIWGLGRAGLKAYGRLLAYLDAESEEERVHAVVTFAPALPPDVVRQLTAILADDNTTERKKASAAYVLSMLSDTGVAITELIALVRDGTDATKIWAKAVLGSLPPETTSQALRGNPLAEEIRPLQLLSASRNWTKNEAVQSDINTIRRQTVFPT